MRVFDDYRYNLIQITPFNRTKEYLDKTLKEIGVSYRDVGFLLHCGKVDLLFQKYPSLKKYCRIQDPSRDPSEYGNRYVTSLSPDWTQGRLYAAKEDIPSIEEIFRKIPRPWNFGFAKLMLDGIDWYQEGALPPALNTSHWQNDVPPFLHAVGRSGIFMEHDFDDGKKRNTVWVRVEATTPRSPRDTSDIVQRLTPYLGTPEDHLRRCFFSSEEYERTQLLQTRFNEQAALLFETCVSKGPHKAEEVLFQPFLAGLCEKRTIQQALKRCGLRAEFTSGNLKGANVFFFQDSHGFTYEVLIDRSPSSNCITFHLTVNSYNFALSVPHKRFWFLDKEEVDPMLDELIRFVIRIREEQSDQWAEAFGNRPDWFGVT